MSPVEARLTAWGAPLSRAAHRAVSDPEPLADYPRPTQAPLGTFSCQQSSQPTCGGFGSDVTKTFALDDWGTP